MESLNLLRYLVIRDKVTENQVSLMAAACDAMRLTSRHVLASVFGFLQTGIWTELYKIEDTFLKPLRVGVNMSRAHYQMELHNTMEGKKSNTKGQSIAPASVVTFEGNSTNGDILTCSSTEDSLLSVTVGDEKFPNMTSESHIEVCRCLRFTWLRLHIRPV